jgi:hypothetical protein
MTADQWNARLVAWGTSLAGRQWQAEVGAPQPGRPFYASLATIPAHVNTAAPRAAFSAAWLLRVADVDARHAPHAAGAAAATLEGLLNAIEMRDFTAGPHADRLGPRDLDLRKVRPPTSSHGHAEGRSRGWPSCRSCIRLRRCPDDPRAGVERPAVPVLRWRLLPRHQHPGEARVTIAGRPGRRRSVQPARRATTVTRSTRLHGARSRREPSRRRGTAYVVEHGLRGAIDFNVPRTVRTTRRVASAA